MKPRASGVAGLAERVRQFVLIVGRSPSVVAS
jgi:hypothetical protein